jgi:Ser/Thr protein kinase RdoA (MazF antagonist)
MLGDFGHLLPEVIFDAVEALGGRCTGRFLALHAMENRVYDVEREDQENVVVKFYRPGRWSEAAIRAEHEFLAACAEAEVPVVCAQAGAGGRTLFEIQGIHYAVFPKRPGRLEPELPHDALKRLGRYLARIHDVGAAFRPVERARLTADTYGRESLALIQRENLLPPGLAPIFARCATEICDLVEPMLAATPYVLTHGDCHAGNVLWRDGHPYFIDFDDMLYAPPVQDFWMLIGGDDEVARKNCDVLLSGYTEIRPFDAGTLDLIEPLRALRMLHFSAWIARRRADGAFRAAFPDFGTEKYWQEQIETLYRQLDRLRAILERPSGRTARSTVEE